MLRFKSAYVGTWLLAASITGGIDASGGDAVAGNLPDRTAMERTDGNPYRSASPPVLRLPAVAGEDTRPNPLRAQRSATPRLDVRAMLTEQAVPREASAKDRDAPLASNNGEGVGPTQGGVPLPRPQTAPPAERGDSEARNGSYSPVSATVFRTPPIQDALGAGLRTPPHPPTAGLRNAPEDAVPGDLRSDLVRGQETRAQREIENAAPVEEVAPAILPQEESRSEEQAVGSPNGRHVGWPLEHAESPQVPEEIAPSPAEPPTPNPLPAYTQPLVPVHEPVYQRPIAPVHEPPHQAPAAATRAPARAEPGSFGEVWKETSDGRSETTVALARQRYQYAQQLAQKGALYAAEEEIVRALWLVAQGRDERHNSDINRTRLASALLAFEEADAFAGALGPAATDADVARLVASHRTPVLKQLPRRPIAALDALQQYYAYAQEQLTAALGNTPVAAELLYGLARVQLSQSGIGSQPQKMGDAKAIALYQTALNVDPKNYQAANELGVLLARFGRLHRAKEVLVQGATESARAETWHNLSKVCERLGEKELAQQARTRYLWLQRQQASNPGTSGTLAPSIRWVTPETLEGKAAINDLALTKAKKRPVTPQVDTPAKPAPREKKSSGDLLGWLRLKKPQIPRVGRGSLFSTAKRDTQGTRSR